MLISLISSAVRELVRGINKFLTFVLNDSAVMKFYPKPVYNNANLIPQQANFA